MRRSHIAATALVALILSGCSAGTLTSTQTPVTVERSVVLTATSKPTDIPPPISTSKPTATRGPSRTPKPTITPVPIVIILDATKTLGLTVQEVELQLGSPSWTTVISAESINTIPNGGQSRAYQVGKYEVSIDFDKTGIARGLQVTTGLDEDGYVLAQWSTILERMGLSDLIAPNESAPICKRWTNLHGYAVEIMAATAKGDVWSVLIYQVQK